MKYQIQKKISRKNFLHSLTQGLGLITLFGLLPSACRKKSPSIHLDSTRTYSWKMLTSWPKNFPGLGTAAEKLAKNISAMSAGRLKIKVFAAGDLVPPYEVFNAVSKGVAEMGHASAYYWKGTIPEAQFFSTVPFGLTGTEMGAWLRYGGGQALWDELYQGFNLKPFPAANTGVQMGGWFNKPIKNLSSLKGLKIRMPGLGGEVLRKAGATVVSVPGSELFQSMQSGTIDAAEWMGPYNDIAFGFHKVAKYYYWPGWHEPGSVLELLVNKKQYETLSDDLKVIVEQATNAAYFDSLSEFNARNSRALLELTQKHKVKLSRFSDKLLAELAKLSKEVILELAEKSPKAKKIYKSYTAFRKRAILWNDIGEESFSVIRKLAE